MKKVKFTSAICLIGIATLLILSSNFLLGCKDTDITIYNEPRPSTKEKLNAIFNEALISEKQFVHFNALQGIIYISPRGTRVTISPNCLRINGTIANGTVILEFIEIYDRAKMLATNKATMGLLPNKDQEMLISGGEFYVNVTQNGQNLTPICPISIVTNTANTGGTIDGMQAFNGVITDNKIVWEQAKNWDVFTAKGEGRYSLSVPGFGWFNCDKFSNYPEPKTTITANVPSGFAEGSEVFLITKNVPNALGKIYGKFPIGLQCYIVFVTENNGNFMWIAKEQTLTANHTINFDLKEAKVGKKEDLIGYITSLK